MPKPPKKADKSTLLPSFNPNQRAELLAVLQGPDASNENQTVQPSALTASNRIKITGPDLLFVDPSYNGNASTWTNVGMFTSRGEKVRDKQNEVSECDSYRAYLPLEGVTLWDGLGAIVEDYEVFHELSDPEKVCPYDPGGLQNWHEFGVVNGSNAPVEIGGFWYRSNQMGIQGLRLPSTSWAGYITDSQELTTGISRIISIEEYTAIRNANP